MASTTMKAAAPAMPFTSRLLASLDRLALLRANQCICLLPAALPDRANLFTPLLRGQLVVGADGLNLASGALFDTPALLHGAFRHAGLLPAGFLPRPGTCTASSDRRMRCRNLALGDPRQRIGQTLLRNKWRGDQNDQNC